jgi:hypothetical protein
MSVIRKYIVDLNGWRTASPDIITALFAAVPSRSGTYAPSWDDEDAEIRAHIVPETDEAPERICFRDHTAGEWMFTIDTEATIYAVLKALVILTGVPVKTP